MKRIKVFFLKLRVLYRMALVLSTGKSFVFRYVERDIDNACAIQTMGEAKALAEFANEKHKGSLIMVNADKDYEKGPLYLPQLPKYQAPTHSPIKRIEFN